MELVILNKYIYNLRTWPEDEALATLTVDALSHFFDWASGRTLSKNPDALRSLGLEDYSPDNFVFLTACSPELRPQFYATLARVVVKSELPLSTFTSPFVSRLMDLSEIISGGGGARDDPEIQSQVIALYRDFHGIFAGLVHSEEFCEMMSSVHPTLFQTAADAFELWLDCPPIVISVLGCIQEVARDRSSRWNKFKHSELPTLFFRNVSRILKICEDSASDRIQKSEEVEYDFLGLCVGIIRYCGLGQYVAFGEMAMFGDRSLDQAMASFLKLLDFMPWGVIIWYVHPPGISSVVLHGVITDSVSHFQSANQHQPAP